MINFSKYSGGFRYGLREGQTEYTPNEAFTFFLFNLKSSKILTDSSISCITLLLTIKDGIPIERYPYLINRRTEFNKPIKQILLKLFLSSDIDGTVMFNCKQMEETSEETLIKEANTQLDIYRKGFLSNENGFDPICPAILNCKAKVLNSDKDRLKEIILGCFTNRLKSTTFGVFTDEIVLNEYFKHDISFICMEFLDGYSILGDFSSDPRFEMFKQFAFFELLKLYDYGYMHSDFHLGNVMINPNYMYLTDDPTSNNLGRAIIIDFGRTLKHGQIFPDEKTKINFIRNNEGRLSDWNMDLSDDKLGYILDYRNLRKEMEIKFVNELTTLYPGLTSIEFRDFMEKIANNRIMLGGNLRNSRERSGGEFAFSVDREIKKKNKLNNHLQDKKLLKTSIPISSQSKKIKTAESSDIEQKEKSINELSIIIKESLKPYSLIKGSIFLKNISSNNKKKSKKKHSYKSKTKKHFTI